MHKYLKRQKTKKALENLVLAPIRQETKNKMATANRYVPVGNKFIYFVLLTYVKLVRYEIYDNDNKLIFLAENIKADYYSTRFEDRKTPFKAILINEFNKPILFARQTGNSLFGENISVSNISGNFMELFVIL